MAVAPITFNTVPPVGIYRFDAHNKFGNNFVIAGTNANVAIGYTTAS